MVLLDFVRVSDGSALVLQGYLRFHNSFIRHYEYL